jgi:hypothetical protein
MIKKSYLARNCTEEVSLIMRLLTIMSLLPHHFPIHHHSFIPSTSFPFSHNFSSGIKNTLSKPPASRRKSLIFQKNMSVPPSLLSSFELDIGFRISDGLGLPRVFIHVNQTEN